MWKTLTVQGQGATVSVRHLPGAGQRWAVLLHDAGADHRSFRDQVAAFQDGTDLVIPDLRGHGVSILHHQAAATLEGILGDLETLLHTLGVPRLDVVGHGLGAQVAQELAHRYPEHVERLVLIAGQDHHRAPDAAERSGLKARRALVRSLPWSWAARVRAHAATTVPALRRELASTLRVTGRDVVLGLERSAAEHRHPVQQYSMPVLLIRGEHQTPAQLVTVHGCIAARSPRGQAVTIPGTGPLCHREQPDQANAAIRAFRSL